MKNKFSIIFLLLAFVTAISCFCGYKKVAVMAENKNLAFTSKSVYLTDFNSGTVILAKNETEKRPIASMCKIMTLLLSFEAIDNGIISKDEIITVSENAAGMGGSQVFLETGGQYSVNQLLKSITVASANDACVAIAETICGSEELFVEKMNERAKELQMDNTIFANCTGLPKPTQYSCAKDVAKMFSELIKHKEYFEYSTVWMDKIEHPNNRYTEISNTNKLIRFYQGCDCGKTGYTSEAGHCLVASANRNGMRLISVVISSPDSKTRFNEISSMFNYGFANYTNKLIIDDKKPLDIQVNVLGGKQENIQVYAQRPIFLFSEKNEKRSVEVNFIPVEKIKAPLSKGEVVGEIVVLENNNEIDRVKVVSAQDVLEKTYFDYINDISKNWALI
ncbi:MAG: D-alanyl-D-alanine carboxypeptidase [Clostridiales bacterium]|nr:D-alanyl-D-alanine carboxypeptidase [Clostridiales bacterium]